MAATDTDWRIDARRQGQMEYPCSNDHGVIDLKARRLTQMSRKQSQDDGDCRQGKTDVMRNQDPTRLVVADVRKLVLSLVRARDQGGQHFVLAPASMIARAGSITNGVERCSYIRRRESRGKICTPRRRAYAAWYRELKVEWQSPH